ncbi:aminotransferase, LLPSF_NHT_00031 family [Algoriphagus faecimaris]|uniref:Aminotransferase, LLPSF_NHT_00031 family n=1 Tax=Algoriphagus faecimaris TaxID=686796 RepID=A0A1G6PX27_9BACT|nr:LegC family aminotransferase [Algoriphagus faecimaris]SDC84598.1 aminotransferase, LLPSF_NHT_00031 family [Algoriphagus faecimaris]
MMPFKETVQFIQDTFKTKDFIPIHAPVFMGNERKYVMDTLESTFVSSVGAYVDLSERMMAGISQTKKAVAVVNGTAGLQIALQLAGVQRGDEVITQALTFVATANAIQHNGAEPVFLDVDYDTMGLSPKSVSDFLEEFGERRESSTYNKRTGKKISACVPMHTFGFPVHLDELLKVCNLWNIPVVEDAAESLGSYYREKHTGGLGKLGVFSFNGNKIVTSGGGGMIVTNDPEIGIAGKHLTTTAKVAHSYEFYHDRLGYNFRMPNLNAALICAQLEQLDGFLENKRQLADAYSEFFKTQGITFRKELENTRANYWLMCVELKNLEERGAFLKATNDSKTMTRPIWQLMYRLPMYRHCFRDGQKNAEYLEERIVNIPSSVRI